MSPNLRSDRRTADDTGSALLLVVALMLVVASLGLVITAGVLQQVRPTTYGQKATRTVFAAEAGVQVALSQIRGAQRSPDTTGVVRGEPTQLPCTLSGPVVTAADASAGLRYDVKISYYDADPVGQTAAWRTANRLACSPTDGVGTAPYFALIEANGMDASTTSTGNRTLESVYRFDVDNANILGGLMFTVTNAFCLEADSVTVGAEVRYVAAGECTSSDPLQTWVYAPDYAIKLGTSITPTGGGLCLTSPGTANGAMTLQTCVVAQATQLYSYEGGAIFRLQNADNSNYGPYCLGTGLRSVAAGLPVRSSSVCDGDSEYASWAPEFRVGAGAAGKATNQVVSYAEFGRCLDVTNEDVNWPHLILYPCKQDPSPGGTRLYWNHKFFYSESPAPQPIVVKQYNDDARQYCVTTPAASTNPGVVRMQPCVAGRLDQTFTRSGDTGTYASSHTFVDSYGRCLSVGPRNGAYTQFSTVTVASCTGGPEQKWNAPADAIDASLSNTRETVFGS